jgi:dihydrofolate reductase
MSKLRVESFTISLNGFGAGPDQNVKHPLGVGGTLLHAWALPTRTFQHKLFGRDGGEAGVDEEFSARGFQNVGAWIMGRNMFGPVRGPWPDESWRGWWGENPVYHVPVFVLTNYPRPPLVMEDGTTFYFVTEGAAVALERARAAAGDKDVRVGGGVNAIQQYLRLRLIDEMHIAISPVLLGSGERLFEGVNLPALGYACVRHQASVRATHLIFFSGSDPGETYPAAAELPGLKLSPLSGGFGHAFFRRPQCRAGECIGLAVAVARYPHQGGLLERFK